MTQVSYCKERKKKEIELILHPIVREWFFNKFKDFSLTQKYGVMNVWERKNTLISAPTGGTKTLTSFLSILNYLVGLASKEQLEDKVYAVYTSPLKALSNDIEKNLNEPLEEIYELAAAKGVKLQKIRVGLRTGDTSASDRAKMARKIPHILITTPESLAIILTTKKFVDNFKAVEFVIVDEIHSLDNKRGVYLSLNLERLNEISSIWPVKIGLSATIAPIEEVAKFLVGSGVDRHVEIAEVPLQKNVDIQVLTPVSDLIEDENPYTELYELMNNLINEHKTTLIFTNTRAGTERVVNHLKEKFPTEYGEDIAAHHGSLSKDLRFNIEERLRNGELKVVVCSTSLELGIDIGFIDLVIMLGSPKSSARALQRLGRAGHKLHATAKGRFIVTDRDDLIECCVIQKEMIERKINRIRFPRNCLDVLSQTIYGMAIYKIWDLDEVLELIRKSYCFQDLSKEDFMSVISYLTGEYALEKQYVYAKIWYDAETKQIGKRGKLARVIYMTNIGTIPEESFVTVKLAPAGLKIGVIDENFLSRMKKGDVFVLGGGKYVYCYTKGMNLYVRTCVDRPPTIPSWFSEMLPLSFDSALEINRFRKLMNERFERGKSKKEMIKFIQEHLYVLKETAEAIYDYSYEQFKFLEMPNTNKILIERFRSRSKNYVLVHSMYGRHINDALSRALAYGMAQVGKRDIEIGINDNGFYFAGEKLQIEKSFKFLKAENLKEVLTEAIGYTDVLARRFRHCASRALMILRSYKGRQKTVGKQQMRSHFLLAAIKKISAEFPILKEAKREVLEDLMDLKNTQKVLDWIEKGQIQIVYRETKIPSPFAMNLFAQGHMDLIKIEARQDFLKRMHKKHLEMIGKKSEKKK
jgi:ATP-dependent helicase Lhr and Lhr-like helicase